MRYKYGLICMALLCLMISMQVNAKGNANELHGVWISTVCNLDYPSVPTTDANVLKSEIDDIVANCKDMGINAIFLQVRPGSDAIYPSNIYPFSRYLTGMQGVAPSNNFDPLAYWVQVAHNNKIQLHAWINPYRITTCGVTEWSTLAANNPAKLHPEWVVPYSNGNFYFNPGIPEVRTMIEAGIMEIVQKYDVDGIHMDDYFYPGKDFPDTDYYVAYNNGTFSNIEDWRRNNVNLLIQEISQQVHAYKPSIQWGVSPAGIWENKSANPLGSNTQGGHPSYSKLYADTRLWALSGWIDYIAPQIYWNIGHTKTDYITLINWWSETLANSPTKLYIGLADYKTIGALQTDPWFGGSEIARQMIQNEQNAKITGEIHFRYKLIATDMNLRNAVTNEYKN